MTTHDLQEIEDWDLVISSDYGELERIIAKIEIITERINTIIRYLKEHDSTINKKS